MKVPLCATLHRTVAPGKSCINAEEFLDEGTGLPSATVLCLGSNFRKNVASPFFLYLLSAGLVMDSCSSGFCRCSKGFMKQWVLHCASEVTAKQCFGALPRTPLLSLKRK